MFGHKSFRHLVQTFLLYFLIYLLCLWKEQLRFVYFRISFAVCNGLLQKIFSSSFFVPWTKQKEKIWILKFLFVLLNKEKSDTEFTVFEKHAPFSCCFFHLIILFFFSCLSLFLVWIECVCFLVGFKILSKDFVYKISWFFVYWLVHTRVSTNFYNRI